MFMMGLLQNLGKIVLGGIIKDIGKEILTKKINNKGFIAILDANIKENKKGEKAEKLLKDIVNLKMEIFKMDIPKKEKVELLTKLKVLVSKIKKKIEFNHLKNFDYNLQVSPSLIQSDNSFSFNITNNEDMAIKEEIKKILKEIKEILIQSANKKKIKESILKKQRFKKDISFMKSNVKISKSDKKLLKSINEKEDSLFTHKKEIIKTEILTKNLTKTEKDLKNIFEKPPEKTLKEFEFKELKLKIHKPEVNSELLQKKIEFESKILKFDKKEKNSFELTSHHKNIVQKEIKNFKDLKSIENSNSTRKIDFSEKVMLQIKKGIIQNNIKNEVSIKLEPPELGKVHIKLAMINNELTAKITTEHSGVRDIIINNINSLQEALKEKGINLSNFNVNISNEFKDSNEKNTQQKFNKNRKFFSDELFDEQEEFIEAWNLIYEIENNLNLTI